MRTAASARGPCVDFRPAPAIRLDAEAEHMAGYGLLGLAFESGHVLAFRCFTASSIGPPYLAVWHRRPDGRWIIHTNIEPARACPRYFGPALHEWHVDDIEVSWTDSRTVAVTAARARIHIGLRLESSPLTRLLGGLARVVPAAVLERPGTGALVGRGLDAGRLALTGTTPSGHRFSVRPRAVWHVAAGAVVIDGRDAGRVVPPTMQPALGGLAIPARGLFAAGVVRFTKLAPMARILP